MKKRLLLAGTLIALGAAVAIHGALQPDVGLLKFRAKGGYAYGFGDTDDRSVGMVRKFLNDHPEVHTLVLKKMPGTMDVDMNMRIAREIRKRGLNTHLDTDSFIASGAVDLFLAGNRRTMDCRALIGVHSWSSGRFYYPARIGHDPEQKKHEKFLVEMGIDPGFYAFSRDAALPSDMYYLKPAEIERYGLLTEPPKCDADK